MSKGFVISLAAALAIVPSWAGIAAAEESQADAKQACEKKETCSEGKCRKDGKCTRDCENCKDGECSKDSNCCKDGKCEQATASNADSNCKACKCADCKTADCDTSNCQCEQGESSITKCSGEACADCDKRCCKAGLNVRSSESGCNKSDCRCDSVGYAACSQGDCADGKCCNGSCDAFGICGTYGNCSCDDDSALRLTGSSLFSTSPFAVSPVSEEMWQRVADELNQMARPQTRCGSKDAKRCVYLVFDSQSGGDHAIRTECDSDATVSSVLCEASLPHPMDFSAMEICVYRAVGRDKNVLPVRWDEATGKPTKCTDYALQPNDQICVKCAGCEDAPSNAVAAAYAPNTTSAQNPIPTPRRTNAAMSGRVTQVQYSIQIIEDCSGCMCEYEDLREGSPMMFAESKSLLPAMRILEKQQCIKCISSPKLMCTAGQTAQLQVGKETAADGTSKWEGLRLEVESEKFEDGLRVELAMHAAQDERKFEVRTAVLVDEGQTVVLNANAGPGRDEDAKQDKPAVYIVLTPEVLK